MWYKVNKIRLGTQQVRPTILEYDFTQSDWWWTKTSNVSRSSSWYYVSWQDVDWYITPPAEVYSKIPKKIQIIFNIPDNYCWTGIYSWKSYYWYFLPRSRNILNRLDWNYNWTITQNSISLGTGDKIWELDIDSSTTNWTIIHKIKGNSNITDIWWVLKYLWTNNAFWIRTVHWSPSWTWPYIKKVIIEY